MLSEANDLIMPSVLFLYSVANEFAVGILQKKTFFFLCSESKIFGIND